MTFGFAVLIGMIASIAFGYVAARVEQPERERIAAEGRVRGL